MKKSIAIIGSGISGLTVAYLLKEKGFAVTLFEKSNRLGGNIKTVKADGFLIEYAPNSLLKSPRLIDLIKSLGLENEVLTANPSAKKRYVLHNGKLKPLPMSLVKMAFGDFFSLKAKMRLLRESLVKSKSPENESVAAFFERRLGKEIVEKAADPFISGIYAGNPEKLSVRASFPKLFALEKNWGSLFYGFLRESSEKADKNFPRTFSFRNGVQTLTEKLAEKLGGSIKTETEVKRIEKLADGKIEVETETEKRIFDAVILASNAASVAKLMESADVDLSKKLREIYYPPVAMIFFGVKKEAVCHALDGFGFLVSGVERRRILGTIFNSTVFPNRAPDNFHLLTTFVGGARNAEIFEESDEKLFEIVFDELRDILGFTEKPEFMHIKRWKSAIPQYEIGYEKVENALENFQQNNAGIYFCSNFYKGISVGDCIKNAFETADKTEKFLNEQF